MQFILVVLEIVAALLRGASWQLLGDDLPVPTVDLEEFDELLLFVSLPLVESFDAASEESRLIDRAGHLASAASLALHGVLDLRLAVLGLGIGDWRSVQLLCLLRWLEGLVGVDVRSSIQFLLEGLTGLGSESLLGCFECC